MWVARDKSGYLYVYTEKPKKGSIQWQIPSVEIGMIVQIDSALLPEVKWEDEEPTEVDIVPKVEKSNKREESKSIDWEQRRYEIAKAAMVGELAAPLIDGIDQNPSMENIAKWSVMLADALIKELRK